MVRVDGQVCPRGRDHFRHRPRCHRAETSGTQVRGNRGIVAHGNGRDRSGRANRADQYPGGEGYSDTSATELVGQVVELLVPERLRDGHIAQRERFLMNPSLRPGSGRELLGRRKDGTEFPIELGLSPLKSEEGLFVIGVIVDITERKRQMERLQTILVGIPTGMLVLDRAGTICLASTEAERLFRYASGELIGQQAAILIPERLRAGHRDLVD